MKIVTINSGWKDALLRSFRDAVPFMLDTLMPVFDDTFAPGAASSVEGFGTATTNSRCKIPVLQRLRLDE